jgi:hypothetical protein
MGESTSSHSFVLDFILPLSLLLKFWSALHWSTAWTLCLPLLVVTAVAACGSASSVAQDLTFSFSGFILWGVHLA